MSNRAPYEGLLRGAGCLALGPAQPPKRDSASRVGVWGSGSALIPFGWGGLAGSIKVQDCRCRLAPEPGYLRFTARKVRAVLRPGMPAPGRLVQPLGLLRPPRASPGKNVARAAEAAGRGVERGAALRTLRLRPLLPAPTPAPNSARAGAEDRGGRPGFVL